MDNDSSINEIVTTTTDNKPLSKNQLKKLAKREKWLKEKTDRRAKERIIARQKRKTKIEKGIDVGPSRKTLKKAKMVDSNCKVNVVIDLGVSHLMTDRESSKLFKQIQRCYAINRREENPVQFYLTSHEKEVLDKMKNVNGYQNWDINFRKECFSEVFDKSKIVYLTSDSNNIIDKLEDGKAYIIGGLVDHNRLKKICFNRSIEKKRCTCKIANRSKYFDDNEQNFNLFTILLHVANSHSWKKALSDVIPQRKQIRNHSDENSEDSNDDGNINSTKDNSVIENDSSSQNSENAIQIDPNVSK
ncbi:tRNA methyltransferase 10 A [Nymphon striatum]|nr:tRNA methyltransferase 10 A [Nymphon striatum]